MSGFGSTRQVQQLFLKLGAGKESAGAGEAFNEITMGEDMVRGNVQFLLKTLDEIDQLSHLGIRKLAPIAISDQTYPD